jgi:FkbM family methyltransferase
MGLRKSVVYGNPRPVAKGTSAVQTCPGRAAASGQEFSGFEEGKMKNLFRTLRAAVGLWGAASARIAMVAKILGTSRIGALRQVLRHAVSSTPYEPYKSYLLGDLDIASCERVDDHTLAITLKNGRVFLGERSHQREYLYHNLFKDRLPPVIDADSYELALDIQQRYLEVPLPRYCRDGGVFVEGGCYTGMKAIRWHDLCPKPSRILAVELGRRNFELLQANIRANGLEDSIVPIHAGLWSESGEGVHAYAHATMHFLETTDQWKGSMRHQEKVPLLTIDDLLEEHDVAVADYVNIQVNGAELQVLRGIRRTLDRIKVLGIAAYYSQDGQKNIVKVREMLGEMGCTILHETALGRITAVTPKYRDEILSRRPPPKRNARRPAA